MSRPRGGVGWICKRMPNISYKIIDIDNERVSGIQLISKGQVLMNIIGVYLPFYDGSADQIELYAESLQYLHQGEPLVIVGEMNAAFPQKMVPASAF